MTTVFVSLFTNISASAHYQFIFKESIQMNQCMNALTTSIIVSSGLLIVLLTNGSLYTTNDLGTLRGGGISFQEPPGQISFPDADCYVDQNCLGFQVLCANLNYYQCEGQDQWRNLHTENLEECKTGYLEDEGKTCLQSQATHACRIWESACKKDLQSGTCVLDPQDNTVFSVPDQCSSF